MQDARELLEGHIPDFHPEKRIDKRPAIHSVELFSCVDNPRCAAVELAVRGLKEYLSGYGVTVVDYHLSEPAADPLECRIVRNRADYYGVTTTPALFIDGKEIDLSVFDGMGAEGIFNGLSGDIATIEKEKGKMITNSERLGQEIDIEFHPLVDGVEYQSAVLLVESVTHLNSGDFGHRVGRALKRLRAPRTRQRFVVLARRFVAGPARHHARCLRGTTRGTRLVAA